MGEAKRKRENRDWQFCAYCGAQRTSRDHVPPRSLFVGENHSFLTVPACDEHNGRRSDLDERFRDLVSFWVGIDTPHTDALWANTLRGLAQNRKRYVDIRRRVRWLPKSDQYQIPFPAEDFREALKWITRGLYWHHSRKVLPLNVSIEAQMIDPNVLKEWTAADLGLPLRNSIANGQFYYLGGITDDVPTASMWLMVFHHRLVASAMTDTETIEQRGRPNSPLIEV